MKENDQSSAEYWRDLAINAIKEIENRKHRIEECEELEAWMKEQPCFVNGVQVSYWWRYQNYLMEKYRNE